MRRALDAEYEGKALNSRHLILSVLYAAGLSWLLLHEIVPVWHYMNYAGEFSVPGIAAALCASAYLGASVPRGLTARTMIVTSLNYLFFVPSAVYISLSNPSVYHVISFVFIFIGVYYVSGIRSLWFTIAPVRQNTIFALIFALIVSAVATQAAFGGLRHFSLDIEKVYEFRTIAAEEVPSIFGYIFSSVTNVLVPLALALSLRFRRYVLAALIVAFTVVLFGMTHHKSVLFTPFVVLLLYLFFANARSPYLIGGAFLAIPVIAIAEVVYTWYFVGDEGVAYFTSLVVRRVLFTPPMLDSLFVDFFSQNPVYYWSTSRLGAWALESPYGVTAPFMIGIEYFSDPLMSANAGAIGSGFSNARLFGVALYSLFIGVLIGVLNVYGKRIGHATVAAVSFIIVFYVVTTTDLVTAFLTHGLLLLLVVLALFSNPLPTSKTNKPLPA